MLRDPELRGIRQRYDDYQGHYRHPVYLGMLAVLAVLVIYFSLKPTAPLHILDVATIWGIALADWVAKRRWLKRHPEVHDFPGQNFAFVLACLALGNYCWH
ncbi:MAG TPA: hypothetical protein VG204_02515 [Terriglobia bacterium]|nr:hypothetical protein [Terriglobia bacterium]